MNKNLLVEYLNCRRLPVEKHEGATQLHSAICEVAPDFYLRLLLEPATEISHQREILLNFLLHPSARKFGRHSMLAQLYAMPVSKTLSIVEVIRDRRINRNRARDLVLAFLLGHEQFPILAATKRQRTIRLLKHALGERTWSSVKRFLNESSEEGEAFLQRELFRYAWNGDIKRAREVLNFLAAQYPQMDRDSIRDRLVASTSVAAEGYTRTSERPNELTARKRRGYSRNASRKNVNNSSHVDATSARTDGPLTVFYKEAFFEQEKSRASIAAPAPAMPEPVRREGPFAVLYEAFAHLFTSEATKQTSSPGHQNKGDDVQENKMLAAEQTLPDGLAASVALMPFIQGRLEIVLDLSSSMASSGERLYHPIALALALTRLLQERVQDVSLRYVGSSTPFNGASLPLPQGGTDIATALLAAACHKPQAILIISDGYENMRQGDTACVVQGLRQLNGATPIYQVVPLFTLAENLTQRRFGDNIPVIPLAHEEDVRELLAYMLLASVDEDIPTEEMERLQQILL